MKIKKTLLGLAFLALPTAVAWSQVSPSTYSNVMEPGSSVTVQKNVDVPTVTPKLDLLLMIDLSGSYTDDLRVIQTLAPDIFDNIRASVPDSMFGVASFVDFPIYPYGSSGDYAYRLDQDLTYDRDTWISSINGLSTFYGGDGPESQYEALYQAATGAGLDINEDGDYDDVGEIPPGLAPDWRSDATRVIAITTDAEFHDSDSEPDYPGHGRVDTINALKAAGIKVIAIKAPGATNQMDELAIETGGSVQYTSSSSEEIANAIIEGLQSLTFTITASANCEPLVVSFSPAQYTDVPGGTTVTFDETIEVPEGTPPGVYECDVEFYADDTLIGTQRISITVPAQETENYMRGAGYTKTSSVKFGGKLYCSTEQRSTLVVRWRAQQFILTSVNSVTCDSGPFTTLCGTGTGIYFGRGIKTVNIEWCITDNGVPGRNRDTVEIRIWDGTKTYLDITDVLRRGNMEAVEVDGTGGTRGGVGEL